MGGLAPAGSDQRVDLAFALPFFRFEFLARHTIGVGDLPRLDDEPAVASAVTRAGADDVVARLPSRLGTQLGATWPGGSEISFGQWQKLALARGFMRDDPLVQSHPIDPVHLASAIVGTTVFFVAAMPTLVPDGFDPLSAPHLASHREEVLRLTRRLLGAPGLRPLRRKK